MKQGLSIWRMRPLTVMRKPSEKIKLHFIIVMVSRNEKYTFKEMKDLSNKAGNVLKTIGDVEKGDRVFIFMPRSPELILYRFRCNQTWGYCWSFI